MPASTVPSPHLGGAARRATFRIGRFGALGMLLGVAVSAVIALTATPPATAADLRVVAPPTTCSYPALQNQVLVVLDFGDVTDVAGTRPARDVTTVCVVLPEGAKSTVALQAALDQLGWSRVFNSIGMLCSVSGYPAGGCPSGDNYRYWSYWWGVSGDWRYAGVGPASSAAKCAKVEGWRFIDGDAEAGRNQAPRGSALAAGMCAPPPTATTLPPPPSTGSSSGQQSTAGPGGSVAGHGGAPAPGSSTMPGHGAAPGSTPRPATDTAGSSDGPPPTDTGADLGAPPGERAPAGAWADVQTPQERRAATGVASDAASDGLHPMLQMGGSAAVVAAVGALGVTRSRRRRPA